MITNDHHEMKPTIGSVNLAAITISSAELLLQLQMVAHDYLNPYHDKVDVDLTKLFFDSFRASLFSQVIEKKATSDETDVDKTAEEEKDVLLNFASISPLTTVDPQMGYSPPFSSIKPQRKRKMNKAPCDVILNPLSNNIKPQRKIKKKAEPMQMVCQQCSFAAAASIGLNANVATSSAFYANGSTHIPMAPTPQLPAFGTNRKPSSEMTPDQMKQSLEFMMSTLEKSGHMISPVMRANLDKEIKILLKRVDHMISSSSS